jgi:hypothetical protein
VLLSQVFRRSFGGGWLIISGPSPTLEERGIVRLLEIIDLSQSVLLLIPGGSLTVGVEQWVDDLQELLEVQFAQLDPEAVSALDLLAQLIEAGLILAVSGDEDLWFSLLKNKLEPILKEERIIPSQVMWFVGPASRSLGEWMYDAKRDLVGQGLAWLPGCLILQETSDLRDLKPVQSILLNQLRSYALNLVDGATIGIGPTGEVDLWGSPTPSITLGQGWGED